MSKSILLIGCTGFLGKSILYKLLKATKLTIYLVIRNKNGVSYKDRIRLILQEIRCQYEYSSRIIPVNVTYDRQDNMKITICDGLQEEVLNNTSYIINALADINFNRELVKAVQNNTLTALNWLNFCKLSQNKIKYIYVSTAYVNYHLDDEIIHEKVYEKNMSQNTLQDILNKKITSITPYLNTYTYSKQLAEILLIQNQDNVNLHIVRPSIIVCAHKYPYKGYGSLQNVNLAFFGAITGTLAFFDIKKDTKLNCIIPVDKVSSMCIDKIKSKQSFSINHCSYNNNFFSTSKLYEYIENIYNKYCIHPINIKTISYKPYKTMFVGDSLFYKIYSIIYFIIIRLLQGSSLYDIYVSLKFTYKYMYVTQFIKKNKQFIMKKQMKEVDISDSMLHYIDNYMVDEIKLNPLFL